MQTNLSFPCASSPLLRHRIPACLRRHLVCSPLARNGVLFWRSLEHHTHARLIAWRRFIQVLLLGIALLPAPAAQAQSDTTLRSFGEWLKLCQSNHREAQSCLQALTRPEARAGHGGDSYLVPLNVTGSLLMTRSGVFLSPTLLQNIAQVIVDTSRRTEIVTRSGMSCALYSTIETNFIQGSVQETLDSFARTEMDDPAATAVLLLDASQTGKSLRFTLPRSGFIGAYLVDLQRNSGIWANCRDLNADMATLRRNAESFFSVISGSARQY